MGFAFTLVSPLFLYSAILSVVVWSSKPWDSCCAGFAEMMDGFDLLQVRDKPQTF